MLFTVELADYGDDVSNSIVEIVFDKEGIDLLINKLNNIKNNNPPWHEHFMTPSRGGDILTEDKQGGDKNILINHLRIQFIR